jgi:hypothetical protein
VYESDQDAFRHGGAETLREHGGIETYGTLEDNPRRSRDG